MTQNEVNIVEELEKEIVKPEKSGLGEFIEKVKGILNFLGKGKLVEFISTKIVVLIKEIRDVAEAVKEIKEEVKELKKNSGK